LKKKIVVIGTGFAAFRFLKKINTHLYDVTAVSPRNHFLFTPLLPSTTVGTIEFRSIIEPVRNLNNVTYYQAYCKKIETEKSKIICEDTDTKRIFELNFDILIIAAGEVTNTYGIEGVNEYALFLKELSDARRIRVKVIELFENASLPGIDEAERKKFLRFIICGGGPTGVEFAAELHDFIEEDVKKIYKNLKEDFEIILIEAGDKILNSFDSKLSEYTTKIFKRNKIILKIHSSVKQVTKDKIFLNDGSEIDYGLLVWSTGNTASPLVEDSSLQKNSKGKIITDGYFRVKGFENIYAFGDCAEIENLPLPVTAQVAQQEGLYLAKVFNRMENKLKEFSFRNLGMLAYIGSRKALADLPQYKGSGFATFLFWRSAYLTKLVSLKNKILVLFDWFKAFVFGRDVSNF
jgi:NADH:ubiquinone reductase (non-electrogenic)